MAAMQVPNSGLPYYGGKFYLIRDIIPLMPSHNAYVEPFCGGGVVLMNKPKIKRELVNDLDSSLMHLYYVLKCSVKEVSELLQTLPYSEDLFYKALNITQTVDRDLLRNTVLELTKPTEFDIKIACYRLYIMLCSILNTGERFSFTCTGKNPATSLRSAIDRITKIAHRLENVQLVSRDAMDLLKLTKGNNTFVYLDPPYINTNPGKTKEYRGYNKEDMDKLVNWCLNTDCKFMLSNYASILELYPELNRFNKSIVQKTNFATTQGNLDYIGVKKLKQELLVYNYDPPIMNLY